MSNSSVKDVDCEITYTDDLFIVVKAFVGPATLFRWTGNRRMVNQWAVNSLNNTSYIFKKRFSFFFDWFLYKG